MKQFTPQDASLRALAVASVTWGLETGGQLLSRALLAAILVTHHGVGPVTAADLVEHGPGDDEPQLAEAFDDARAERRRLLDEATQLVNAVRYADYDNGPDPDIAYKAAIEDAELIGDAA